MKVVTWVPSHLCMDPIDILVQRCGQTAWLHHKDLWGRYPDTVSHVAVVCHDYPDAFAQFAKHIREVIWSSIRRATTGPILARAQNYTHAAWFLFLHSSVAASTIREYIKSNLSAVGSAICLHLPRK
jgi:hypothetical protein